MQLGSKLQSAAAHSRRGQGLELTSFAGSSALGGSGSGSSMHPAGGDDMAAAGSATAAAGGSSAPGASGGGGGGMLAEDPDLEAYLQVGRVVGRMARCRCSCMCVPRCQLNNENNDLALPQVAINTVSGSQAGGSQGGEGGDEGDSGYAVGDEDLDLDSYINELSAEVEAAAAAESEEGARAPYAQSDRRSPQQQEQPAAGAAATT